MNPDCPHGIAVFENTGIVVKYGPAHEAKIEEAKGLQAVRRAFPSGEVPVPEFYGWRAHDGHNFPYMSLVPGSFLRSIWSSLDVFEKHSITEQLRDIVHKLRSIPQPTDEKFIGSVGGGQVQDLYFRGDSHTAGPFDSIKAFNDSIQLLSVAHVPLAGRFDPYRHLIRDSGAVRFTHADLNLSNIMIDGPPGERRISAIIDWEQSGWYPEYWEYCKLFISDAMVPGDWFTSNWAADVTELYHSELIALGECWDWRRP